MKSYFAKLAARATLANLPASSGNASGSMIDPFDPAAAEAASDPAKNSVEPGSGELGLPRIQPISQKLKRFDSVLLEPEPLTSLSLRRQQKKTQAEPPNDVRLDTSAPGTPNPLRPEHHGLEGLASRTAARLVPAPEPAQVAPLSRESLENEEVNAKQIPDNDKQLTEIEREQAALLRKSDAFMESLLRQREASPKAHEVDGDQTEAGISTESDEKPVAHKQTHLQPQATLRTPEPADDRPSLVIGSLIVEVVPPTSPMTAAPRREIVIVQGTPIGRSAVPSSRRFGLGQF